MKTNFLTALLLSVATQSVSAVQLEAAAAVDTQFDGDRILIEAQLETSSSAASESEVESEWPWSTC